MSRQRTKQKSQSQKRVPAPKQRREPLPISISVKHHLPVSAEGTATDLTVAELEAVAREAARNHQQLDYSTSPVNMANLIVTRSLDHTDRAGDRTTSDQLDRDRRSVKDQNDLINAQSAPDRTRSADRARSTDQDRLTDRDRRDQSDRDRAAQHQSTPSHRAPAATSHYHLDDLDDFDDLIEDDLDDPFDPPTSRKKPAANNKKSRTPQHNGRNSESRARKREDQPSVESINLGVENRFVRVPNAVADQLARQLSPAEEKIFDQIWRLTVGFNREIWRGKISDLMLRTGYSSRATVTKAIAGLSALGLVVVEGRDTNPRGRSYRIVDRAQLLDYTSKAAELDHSIKKPATTHAESSRLVERRQLDRAGDLTESRKASSTARSTSRAFKENHERDDSSGYKPSSSSWEDDENASQVRLIYQDLTGNHWAKGDELCYREIAEIPLPYVILGICYSITRAADHRIGSLKYCLPSIREHHELMKAFPHKDLLEIAYRHIVRVKEAQRTGKWSRQE